jgi:hypothetical protein
LNILALKITAQRACHELALIRGRLGCSITDSGLHQSRVCSYSLALDTCCAVQTSCQQVWEDLAQHLRLLRFLAWSQAAAWQAAAAVPQQLHIELASAAAVQCQQLIYPCSLQVSTWHSTSSSSISNAELCNCNSSWMMIISGYPLGDRPKVHWAVQKPDAVSFPL